MSGKTLSGLAFLAVLSACGGGGSGESTAGAQPLTATSFALSSDAFSDGTAIPSSYRCVGQGGGGKFPKLSWSNLPQNTKSLVIVMDDEDAVAVQGSTFTHYLAVIPYQAQVSAVQYLPELSNSTLPLEQKLSVAGNSVVVLSDLQPCNPTSSPHNYRWTIYALNTEYNSIPDMKSEIDTIVDSAFASSATVLNLNQFQNQGNGMVAVPRITRQGFANKYGAFITGTATLTGKM